MKKTRGVVLYCLLGLIILLFIVGYYFYVPDIPVEQLNQKYGIKEADYLEVEGMKVHYRVEGLEHDTVALVLLHGTGSSLYAYGSWAQLLKENHKIIRLDLPGFGLTGPHPEGDYTVATYLEFLNSFLSHLGISKCILAGNSIGGEIAWRYALNHPEQVQKLVLIDAAGYPTTVDYVPFSYVILRIPLARELLVKITPPDVIRESLEYLYADDNKVTDGLVELYTDLTRREGNREALTERMESISNPAPYEQIHNINIPTLILWGEKDELIPLENGKRFHKDLPNSTLVVFPEAGHMPMEEVPEETALALEQFLKSHSPEQEKTNNPKEFKLITSQTH